MPNAELQAWVTLLKDIFTGLAAIVAAGVAVAGLQTWQKQLRAQAEYDLARRVLIAVYKVRDAIRYCRLIAAKEGDKEGFNLIKQLHDQRIADLEKASASLDVELLEANAVWGDENNYSFIFSSFQVLTSQMVFAHLQYYSDEDYIDAKHKAQAYSLLFDETTSPEFKDEFSTRVTNAVKRIEDMLRPKLTLKRRKRKKIQLWQRFKKQKK